MSRIINLTGKKFNRLTVNYRNGSKITPNGTKRALWFCTCDCGKTINVESQSIRTGNTKSCGCLEKELNIKRSTTHNMRSTPEYDIWASAKQRVSNPNNKGFKNYGGRGIRMSKLWFNSFSEFIKDMGKRPSVNYTIERIDNNGNYCKENCKWATRKVQGNNTRHCKYIEYDGEIKTLTQWCEYLNLPYHTIKRRLYRGWSIKDAFVKPIQNRAP